MPSSIAETHTLARLTTAFPDKQTEQRVVVRAAAPEAAAIRTALRGKFRFTPNDLELQSVALEGGPDLRVFLNGKVAPLSDAVYNLHVTAHHPKVNVPVLWWRSVGHTHSAFVMETLIDELAARARMDPIAYRRRLLNPDAKKLRAALDLMESRKITVLVVADPDGKVEGVVHLHDLWKTEMI